MADELDDKNKEINPPSDPSTENKDPKNPSDKPQDSDKSPKDDKEKEPMIPKHRFDEVAREAKLGKEAMDELARFKRAFAGEKDGGDEDGVIADFAKKYDLKEDFTRDLLRVSTAQAEKKLKAELKPLQEQQAQASFRAEVAALEKEFPDAVDMTKEEREEFFKLAGEPRFRSVPLTDLWKIKTHGKPAGKTKTAESGRSGGGKSSEEDPDIANMSLAEFEKYSSGLAKKSGNKF
jgi:hypothetical protein